MHSRLKFLRSLIRRVNILWREGCLVRRCLYAIIEAERLCMATQPSSAFLTRKAYEAAPLSLMYIYWAIKRWDIGRHVWYVWFYEGMALVLWYLDATLTAVGFRCDLGREALGRILIPSALIFRSLAEIGCGSTAGPPSQWTVGECGGYNLPGALSHIILLFLKIVWTIAENLEFSR